MSEQAPAIVGIAALAVDCPDPPGRLHLELRSRDLAAATEQALALGATRADEVDAGAPGRFP